jgi:hypothetical protein
MVFLEFPLQHLSHARLWFAGERRFSFRRSQSVKKDAHAWKRECQLWLVNDSSEELTPISTADGFTRISIMLVCG